MSDSYHLARFVDAQAPVYDTVLTELRGARKRSHWIWFIFPQLAGLGSSPTAARFAISGLPEAQAYLAHDVLGPRLRECVALVAAIEGVTIEDVFGWPDYLKVRSSLTLFAHATADNGAFLAVLDKFYAGAQDDKTLALLAAQ
ncbi:DUF1810 domain-containing protein [soil metagenome]